MLHIGRQRSHELGHEDGISTVGDGQVGGGEHPGGHEHTAKRSGSNVHRKRLSIRPRGARPVAFAPLREAGC